MPQYNGAIAGNALAGFFPTRVEVTTSGTWVVPMGVWAVRLTGVGGGAGAGEANLAVYGLAPGGPGYVATRDLSVTPGQVLTITIGAAGTSATGSAGSVTANTGGTTTVVAGGQTVLTADGGGTGIAVGNGGSTTGVGGTGFGQYGKGANATTRLATAGAVFIDY